MGILAQKFVRLSHIGIAIPLWGIWWLENIIGVGCTPRVPKISGWGARQAQEGSEGASLEVLEVGHLADPEVGCLVALEGVMETFWAYRDDFRVITSESDDETKRDDFRGVTSKLDVEPMLSRNQLKVSESLQRRQPRRNQCCSVVLPRPDLITDHKSWSGRSATSEVTTWSRLGSGYDYDLGKSCQLL